MSGICPARGPENQAHVVPAGAYRCIECGAGVGLLASDVKPLHVRVAEALGCKPVPVHTAGYGAILLVVHCGCDDLAHGTERVDASLSSVLKNYDTDWSATGPLIERYGISLARYGRPEATKVPELAWVAFINNINLIWASDTFGLDGYADDFEYGHTPLVAVCNLILELRQRGSLPTG